MWQNSRAEQREDPRAYLCRASLLTLKSLLWIKNIGEDWERARIQMSTRSYQNYKTQRIVINIVSFLIFIYSYFEKGCRKNCARDNPEG